MFSRVSTFKAGKISGVRAGNSSRMRCKEDRTPILRWHALFISVLSFAFASSGNEASPMTITATDADHPITLRMGQELTVNLASNPSTGYHWFLASTANSILANLGKPTYKPGRAVPGAGGVESWTLRAAETGAQTLKFEYRRPWEKNTLPAKTLLFHVTVVASLDRSQIYQDS
jgi:inhibitor of cysteine peptidase